VTFDSEPDASTAVSWMTNAQLLDSLTHYARTLNRSRDLTQDQARDLAVRVNGFRNFDHARLYLVGGRRPVPLFQAFISVSWRDRETNLIGRETLEVSLQSPLYVLVKPDHLTRASNLTNFSFWHRIT
jgi:hypothetical protein